MQGHFEEFYDSDEPTIQKAAGLLEIITLSFKDKEITKEQYNELVNDIIETAQIVDLANDLDRKLKIQKSIEKMVNIATNIGDLLI